jgi:hypothetical protein
MSGKRASQFERKSELANPDQIVMPISDLIRCKYCGRTNFQNAGGLTQHQNANNFCHMQHEADLADSDDEMSEASHDFG